MEYIKYPIIFVSLCLLHMFCDFQLLLVSWCILGAVSALLFRNARSLLLYIVGSELLIGILFWVCFWRGNDSIAQMAYHSTVPFTFWPLTAIAVNSLSAFLCTATFFYPTKRFLVRMHQ